MATADVAEGLMLNREAGALHRQLRRLTTYATIGAAVTSPAVFLWYRALGLRWWWALIWTVLSVIAFRGFIDVCTRRLIPWPSLFGTDDRALLESDVVARRRAWWWRRWYSRLVTLAVLAALLATVTVLPIWYFGVHINWHSPTVVLIALQFGLSIFTLPILFLVNIVVLFGPLMIAGITQMRGYEPGDADWGVRLADVRGQAEAKEEVRKIVSLWQSGEIFERAGGKRERGILFHGPPGTGKTMLAKGIATSFNAPFIAMPGSGFAQTFIGMDVIIVRFLIRKAKRLARKWGGTCIVFIDEIDAVGLRRQSLQKAPAPTMTQALAAGRQFYGEWGALNPSGDVIVESQAWREYIFDLHEPEPARPGFFARIVGQVPGAMFGGGGMLALNQLLVAMDGLDNPPFLKRAVTNRLNTWLDASYVVPRRLGRASLRLRPPRPRKEQVYFIGATNVPLDRLDPALMRPGRMGRHVWFRTPTKKDRADIFDLYMKKVEHAPELDTEKRRDEIARITGGYSPARIEQVCSLALTYAHHRGLNAFDWSDLIQAMSVVEAGAAYNVEYNPAMARSTAIHEAGHAAAAHIYRPELESSRISIKMRAGSFGHHQAREREETFGLKWRREYFGELVYGLGAMAAELVFYGETETGVGGDLSMVTTDVAEMVGAAGMGAMPVEVNGHRFGKMSAEETRKHVLERAEQLGLTIMNRQRGSADYHQDPIATTLNDPFKRRIAAMLLGQAFVTAYVFVKTNKDKVERVAEMVLARGELYGDELLALLDEQEFVKPEIAWTEEESWPRI